MGTSPARRGRSGFCRGGEGPTPRGLMQGGARIGAPAGMDRAFNAGERRMLADRDKLQRRRGMIFDNYPRHPRRAFRPRVDALEGRALMALFPGNPFTLPAPTQFSGG